MKNNGLVNDHDRAKPAAISDWIGKLEWKSDDAETYSAEIRVTSTSANHSMTYLMLNRNRVISSATAHRKTEKTCSKVSLRRIFRI